MSNKTKPKPRIMWALYDSGRDPIVCGNRSLIRVCERSAGVKAIRVAVIPLSDTEAIRDRVSEAIANQNGFTLTPDAPGIKYRAMADAALTAAGIPYRKARK